ncbi:adenosine deaminase [Histomonas meleagridis]|uniref:adenosine deaminase n=1 Tax=Histomonas meleagridis TaxID=135588 RepID=UPI0035598589|nr:adenosine deaminase [Histomonas meleagridis]KAH0806051.1 adenosine deaminase [Histomonas meleagridis]
MQTKLTYEIMQKLPKAELHCHLDGFLRPQTVLDLAKEQNVELPVKTLEEIKSIMTVPLDCPDLVTYLKCFDLPLLVMQYPYAITRIFYEACEDAVKDGITYLELRFAPALHTNNGNSYSQILEAAIQGCIMAEKKLPITARIICCAMRHMSPEVNAEIAEICWRYRHRYVVAFDLAGPEYNFPPHKHVAAFRTIREKSLGVTIHAGEAFGARSVDLALACAAQRIGHGTRVVEDQKVLDEVIDRRIPLECCVSSNVQTKAVQKLEDHPIKKLFDLGAITVPCTDNPTVSGVTLTNEYMLLQDKFNFTVAEILKCIDYGFRSAFVSEGHRKRLRVQAFIKSMKILQENNIDISGVIANSDYYAKIGLTVPPAFKPIVQNPPLTLSLLQQLSKCDLDCRLIGSVPFGLLYEFYTKLSEEERNSLPKFASAEEMKEFCLCKEEEQFHLKGKALAISLLQTEENIRSAVNAILDEAFQDKVIYMELTVCPLYHIKKELTSEKVVEIISDEIEKFTNGKDMTVKIVINGNIKTLSPLQIHELAKLAVKCQDKGVVGFTTTTAEISEEQMRFYEQTFNYLRQNHIPVTMFAGESNTESVNCALIRGHARRISGGFKIAQSETLLSDVTSHNNAILFNLSPRMKNAVKGWHDSPVRFFYDFGVRLAFCSIHNAFTNKSRSQQLFEIAEASGFDAVTLLSIMNNSFASICLHYKDVNKYQKRFWKESIELLKQNGYTTFMNYSYFPTE